LLVAAMQGRNPRDNSVGNAVPGDQEAQNGVAMPTRPTERHRGRSLQSPG
jgi:hypothetical protein